MVFEGFLDPDELAEAQEALWLHYPRPRSTSPTRPLMRWLATDQWAGIVGGPWRSWSLNRLAFHPDLLDLAERFLGSADLRLYEAELWAKYAGAVDYDQRHHRDFVEPQPRRAQALPARHADVGLDPPRQTWARRKALPRSFRCLSGRASRTGRSLGITTSRTPCPRDVRGGGGLDDRSRRNPLRVSDRRTSPWVVHDRRTINPLRAPRQLRRVGTAAGPAGSPGPNVRRVQTGSRSSSGRLPASGRCSASPLRATRTGTSRPWPTP